ncbi:hypothetical protein B0T17DRAFT_516101 [Bombardia bombarda]|uniref:Uncharacterized protein n=1 Tax=Bombardia bombarda TaxID=252184 RepID=A0AA39XJW6_9PEZI|nr:hypothetical protein B0T17DRAFT_516101 [Bombardia bombarda]
MGRPVCLSACICFLYTECRDIILATSSPMAGSGKEGCARKHLPIKVTPIFRPFSSFVTLSQSLIAETEIGCS